MWVEPMKPRPTMPMLIIVKAPSPNTKGRRVSKRILEKIALRSASHSQRIQHVDQLPQTAVVPTIEIKRDAWEAEALVVFHFLRVRLSHVQLFSDHDVAKVFVQRLNRGFGRRMPDPDD